MIAFALTSTSLANSLIRIFTIPAFYSLSSLWGYPKFYLFIFNLILGRGSLRIRFGLKLRSLRSIWLSRRNFSGGLRRRLRRCRTLLELHVVIIHRYADFF